MSGSWSARVRAAALVAAERRAAARGPVLTGGEADAQPPHVVRIRPAWDRAGRRYHEAHCYTARRTLRTVSDAEQDAWIAQAMEQFPGVDWMFGHDYYPATGVLLAAPGVDDPGFLPDEDGEFGGSPAIRIDHPWTDGIARLAAREMAGERR